MCSCQYESARSLSYDWRSHRASQFMDCVSFECDCNPQGLCCYIVAIFFVCIWIYESFTLFNEYCSHIFLPVRISEHNNSVPHCAYLTIHVVRVKPHRTRSITVSYLQAQNGIFAILKCSASHENSSNFFQECMSHMSNLSTCLVRYGFVLLVFTACSYSRESEI